MAGIRSFLAIPLEEELRREVRTVQRELGRHLPAVRWSAPETIHLTLRFFGEIPEEALEAIGKVMLSVGGSTPPFQLEVRGAGAFPSPGRPRVIWLGLTGQQGLQALHRSLEEGLETIGFPPEGRPYSPHLTLGRSRDRLPPVGDLLESFRARSLGPLPVREMVLYESRLQPGGAVHSPRLRAPLTGGPPPGDAGPGSDRLHL